MKSKTHNKEKIQLIETGLGMTQLIEFIGEDIKTVIIAVFYIFKE